MFPSGGFSTQVSVGACSNRVRHFVVATLAALLVCLPLLSQSNEGRISGGVFDQTGGAIVGAMVTVTDVARGVARPLTADSAGQYSAPNLLPGTYTVRAEAKGFQTVEHTGVLVQVGQDIRVDLTLQAGAQAQTVTVTADVPAVETTSATLGGTLNNATINDLPLNGRDFTRMIDLRPGVVSYPGGGDHSDSANGVDATQGMWLLDGVMAANILEGGQEINFRWQAGQASSFLPIDAIQEFNTLENPKAEYGWAVGAIINVGLKSGTNSIHGTAYAFGRDTALDARNFFDQAPAAKTPVELEQYGVTAGGPIKKDKLFWFVGYERVHLSVGDIFVGNAPASVSLATLGLAPDPSISMVDACNALNPSHLPKGAPGNPINTLSAQLAGLNTATCAVSPASSTVENLFPYNAGTNPGGPSTFLPTISNSSAIPNGVVKLDYHINDHHSVNGSFFISDDENSPWVTAPNQVTALGENFLIVRTKVLSANWDYTPNSSWVNEFRVGWNSLTLGDTGADVGTNQQAPFPSGFGIPNGVTNPQYYGIPTLNIIGFPNFSLGHGLFSDLIGPAGEDEVGDNISYLHGKHSFKFGPDYFYVPYPGNTYDWAQGNITFGSLENYLTGTPESGHIFVGNGFTHEHNHNFAVFFQDDYRATNRLTLNLGIRWEYATPFTESSGLLGGFNPTTGLTHGNGLVNPYYKDISPRIGAAWDIRGNGKTVVRSAFSLMYPTEIFAKSAGGATNVPFGFDQVVNGVTTPGSQAGSANVNFTAAQLQAGWNTTGPIFPATGARLRCGDGIGGDPPPCNTSFVDPNLQTPRILNWNADIQRALTNDLTLSVGYVGNHYENAVRTVDINQPPIGAGWFGPSGAAAACLASATDPIPYDNCNPSQADITAARPFEKQFPYLRYIGELENVGVSNYDGLQVTLTQRSWHGLFFLAGYTYQHALDDFLGAPPGRGTPQDTANPMLDYASSDYDIRHRLTLSLTYNIPSRKSPGQLLQGWAVNSLVTLQSGLPWGIMDTSDDFPGTRELFNGGQTIWDYTGNTSAFTSGPNNIPCYGPAAGCTPFTLNAAGVPQPPAACMTAAQAHGPLAVASLMNLGCYMQNGGVMTPPAYGSLSGTGRNIFRDSGFRNWDLSLTKDWKFKERMTAQFRAEFFNVLNHPNFANPYGSYTTYYNNDPSSGLGFGCGCITPDAASGNFILGSGGARDIQLGLKLIF
jgi:hypothetical protein